MKKTLKQTIKSKKGTIIECGETVEVKFDVEKKDGGISCYHFSINAPDERRIVCRNPRLVGFRVPSPATMHKWSNDGIAKSVFGEKVEPDGIDCHGSPSWIMFLGYI